MAVDHREDISERDSASVFVYGTLKPGQIAHERIRQFVDGKVRAELRGYDLVERDGLPFARLRQNDGSESERETPVSGWLLTGPDTLADAIETYEPGSLYKKQSVEISTPEGNVQAWTFVQRKATKQRARVIPNGSWEAHLDPVFARGFPTLFQSVSDRSQPLYYSIEDGYWDEFWHLQGLFLNLSTVLERFAKLLYGRIPHGDGDSDGPTSRIALLDEDTTIQEAIKPALDVTPEVSVFEASSRKNDEYSTKSDKPFQAWYQVRSNVVHQGKTPGDLPSRDTRVLKDSADGLSRALALALSLKIPELTHEWKGTHGSESLVTWIRDST